MSRRLRGQTTLQTILGKSTINKKGNAGKQDKGSGPRKALKASSKTTDSPVVPDTKQPIVTGDLPKGYVACPICQQAKKEADINVHIGKLC